MESTEWGFAYISISSEVMKQLWMCVNESKQQTEISEWICWHRASRAAASWRGSCCVSAASQVSPAVCRLQHYYYYSDQSQPLIGPESQIDSECLYKLTQSNVFPFRLVCLHMLSLSVPLCWWCKDLDWSSELLHTDSHRPGLHREHWRNEAAEQHSFACCSQLWALDRSVQSDQLEVVRWAHREWSWLQELGHFWIWARFLLWGSVLCVLFKRKMVGL